MENKKGGMSDSDNEMAGRALIMGAIFIAGIIFILVSPVLIGGFLIGLLWYGAYVEDGEPNGDRLMWPMLITAATFIYWLGLPPPATKLFEGVLFTDLW